MKDTSAMAVKPASIVQVIFAIAVTDVPNVPLYVKVVQNSVRTVPEKFVLGADIAAIVPVITAGAQTVICVATVSLFATVEMDVKTAALYARIVMKNVPNVLTMKSAEAVTFVRIV